MFRHAVLPTLLVSLAAAQNPAPAIPSAIPAQALPSTPARNALTFEQVVDLAIRQERRLDNLMRNFRPIIETYIQEERTDPTLVSTPKSDTYFLNRLDLTGDSLATQAFSGRTRRKKRSKTFDAAGFAQALFPDLDHFDRENYTFEFARWEVLGDVRCIAMDVRPLQGSRNRGFVGRVWVEDQDYNIVRFTGAYSAKRYARRAFHFDSWRLNTLGVRWMPAYVYTEDSHSHGAAQHGPWFKAQTRIWGYNLEHAGDHREFAKPLTDTPGLVDPKRKEASQNLNPALTVGRATYTPEDRVVERLQVAGLMAPDGEVNQILEAVVNNLLITNNLDIAGVRCRVLLTTPIESFVVGRTIVVSRGLLDVLPDEATLAAVLAHELAHIILQHSIGHGSLAGVSPQFSDREIFSRLNFRFDPAQEAEADRKALELYSKSPYKDQVGNVARFVTALEAHSAKLPNLVHSRFSNDFGNSHLLPLKTPSDPFVSSKPERLDQISALPLGSRITVDPWSDRIEMLKSKPVPLQSAAEKRPFEVSPFFPYLKRLGTPDKAQAGAQP